MHLRTALAASVSVAALLSTTFAATAQTDLTALYEAAKAEGQAQACLVAARHAEPVVSRGRTASS